MTRQRGEFAYINWIRGQLPARDARTTIGIGDDMAEVRTPDGRRVMIGTDMILDGVHFDSRGAPLESIGWKSLAVNLSDVAAMAGTPLAAVGAVALPTSFSMAQAQELFAGMKRCAAEFDCSWVGGDITAWDKPLAINVTVIAHADQPVLRSGARPGHLVGVTGQLGGSLLGKHLTFMPRIREAQMMAMTAPLGAMMDISDGLSGDVLHICDESHVGVLIESARLPVSDAARELSARDGRSAADHALNDGEDFELLFTISPEGFEKLRSAKLGVPVTMVGRVTEAGERRWLVDEAGRRQELKPGGYEHWR